ncbi:MAG TPA: penicillin acylase family protein, partial [Paraburkholderia sp.]|nr:penicillin acylase family protein [Paraburkholderia sp.]
DGTHAAPSLSAPVTIERDALGVPTLRGATRLDVAWATGFTHAQDRFFQMDLLRRVAAGEMSALVGSAALELDRRNRPHRFRERARDVLATLPADQRQLIERYTAGVNAGLASLAARPFEYWLLRTRPSAWRPEDSLLVVYAMYFDLQSHEVRRILSRAAMRERMPADVLAFLLPQTSRWDAPFDVAGSPPEAIPTPPSRPDWLHSPRPGAASRLDDPSIDRDSMIGSNGWVVDGAHAAHGGALLASDMHLGLSLPNIWYRLSLVWQDTDGHRQQVSGVSLPGGPIVIAGSNGQIAWGFTNSYGRFIDLIELQRNPADPLQYRAPDGNWERAVVHHERIAVKGGADVDLPVVDTRWGPQIVVGSHAYALRWVAHDREAVNLNLQHLEDATGVADALKVAQTSGIPTQNFMVADAHGHIGWTLCGPLPNRNDSAATGAQDAPEGDFPVDASHYRGWRGYLPAQAYPSRMDPPLGRLWTANNRTLPPAEAALAGDAGADIGARASQIRDDLLALPHAAERDMLSIQTDDRALWIDGWRRLALSALDDDALRDHPQRAAFRHLVETWNGRADADATGYRLVRAFYFSLYDAWFGKLDADLAAENRQLDYRSASSRYGAVMEALAAHHAWIPDGFADWRAFMLERIDHAIAQVSAQLPRGASLDEARWGERNRAAIAHPFARLVPAWLPWLRDGLSAPHDPLPGDFNMPRVQAPEFGASERMVVSPGREQDGIFEMPGGQSGNPLSPFFLAGHEAWVRGEAEPFLPGKAMHRLELMP